MDIRKWAKLFGWAVAYYVGGGLLFALGSSFLLLGLLLPPEVWLRLIIGFPLLFAFVAIYHGCTGRWAQANYYLRQSSLMILWAIAFYLGFILLVVLVALGAPPGWRETIFTLIFFSPLAGGWAGSLCWRGKLPGTWKPPQTRRSKARRRKGKRCRPARCEPLIDSVSRG